ncbi:coiled-coil domain-containing protein 171-like [Anoplopoma fimbria]|uniref:coiled-coil domain-containing protein 171-like n=1 Tax=Anoplopoma fimbria TaxID=229290 RepID=UPI0023EDDA84|nr:coiled-coil domain-containing protein 171-like [Anoplopoma fimbria]
MQTEPAERRRRARGRREEDEEGRKGEKGPRRDRSRGGRSREAEERSRRAASEGGDGGEQSGRRRVHQLEKERLELTSTHNQEVCRLQAELTRLRSSVERGEAQRVELQYQLTLSQRDSTRASELTERAAELQLKVMELQKALDFIRQARDEDQHALQQEVEERDRLIHSFGSESQRLHRLLQEQEEALEESERRMASLQRERDEEAEENRRRAGELKYLTEREERSRREKEASDQRVKSLEASVEAERAAHLESKFNSEIVQLRGRDLEAALVAERSGQQEAQCGLELLKAQLREAERATGLERERSSITENTLQRLQKDYEQYKSDLSVALETERTATSDLTWKLEEEKRLHANTHTLLEEEAQRRRDAEECLKHIRDTLQLHNCTGTVHPAKHDGKRSPSVDVLQLLKTTLLRLETADRQVQDLLPASERLHEENQTLRRLTSDQSRQLEESQQLSVKLEEEAGRLRQESSDWTTLSRGLRAELEREREEREREKEREREERTAEVQKITDYYQQESKVRLSFLYLVYQRLLAGCVLLDQPQSILGDFTWKELCEVITEQVDQLTSDLRRAEHKIAQLQGVCEKKSVCVRELQLSQECVLSRLEESARRREEAWSSRHTHTVTRLQKELQLSRSQCDSLRDHASSLELRASSLTSDLSRSRGESASFLAACALLAGALTHGHRRLRALSQQKTLVCRRLAEREELEEEVRRLAGALGGEEEEDEEEERKRRRRRMAVRRWRRSVCVVMAVKRWRALTQQTTVLFRLETGVCVCGGVAMATEDAPTSDDDEDDEGVKGACSRWLRSQRLSSIILSSMADLQGALAYTGSAPPDVMSAARSALSRLLDRLLDQSDAASSLSPSRVDEDNLKGRLGLGLSRGTPPRPNMKALVSGLQQHFLLFSQRLHSAEVERRSLRLEVANLKRGRRQDREDTCRTVPVQRFHSVCVELRQALSREQEAQSLIQEQTDRLHTLQLRVNTHTAEHNDTQRTLSATTQSLLEARQEVSRKERSLRILGKHLSGVQKERRQLEERLQRVEDELRDADRRKDYLISNMKAAEKSYKEVREILVQSRRSQSAPPRPLPLPREHLELSAAESIMGAPEVAACQSLLSSVSQLCLTCSSRIDWLEQEVSAYRGHVTALRGELQDACLRDNLAYVPAAEFAERIILADVEVPQPVPVSDLLKEPSVCLSPAPSQTNLFKPLKSPRTREKKASKKSRGGRR